jgi:snurportin-1
LIKFLKQRRLQKVDSSRQLDFFANLHLGQSDDEDDDGQDVANIPHQGVASFASLLEPSGAYVHTSSAEPDPVLLGTERTKKSKNKQKNRTKSGGSRKPSKWADQCMYAELLEMSDDEPWSSSEDGHAKNGLPEDLESGWLAVSPVPSGKRCLAVTYQSSGIAGIGMTLV